MAKLTEKCRELPLFQLSAAVSVVALVDDVDFIPELLVAIGELLLPVPSHLLPPVLALVESIPSHMLLALAVSSVLLLPVTHLLTSVLTVTIAAHLASILLAMVLSALELIVPMVLLPPSFPRVARA